MTTVLATTALTAAAAPAHAQAPVSVRVVKCSVEEHEAAFHARMRMVDGATRMAMRFRLLEQTADEGSQRVNVPGIGKWHRSKPGVRRFGYRQGFRNLPANATHRVRVSFRWYSAEGEVVLKATRRSGPCRQFTVLPNLAVDLTRVARSGVPGVWRYEATVVNTGRAAATAVPVRLTVDGDVIDTRTLASLAPGEERSIVIRGPRCDRLARLEADPEKAIAESSDDDNSDELDCASLMNPA